MDKSGAAPSQHACTTPSSWAALLSMPGKSCTRLLSMPYDYKQAASQLPCLHLTVVELMGCARSVAPGSSVGSGVLATPARAR